MLKKHIFITVNSFPISGGYPMDIAVRTFTEAIYGHPSIIPLDEKRISGLIFWHILWISHRIYILLVLPRSLSSTAELKERWDQADFKAHKISSLVTLLLLNKLSRHCSTDSNFDLRLSSQKICFRMIIYLNS